MQTQTIADISNSQPVHDQHVLVVVLNDPLDLDRARHEHWYRIPVARAPRQVAAEYLAFYFTGAFPEEQRWSIRCLAPVLSYRIARRVELLPEELAHPRALELYYKIVLGPLQALDRPVVSSRLRRITFIPTTLCRLQTASEINDLWLKGKAQERLWQAIKQAGLAAERQYPLREDDPNYIADFAVFCRQGKIAVTIATPPAGESVMREYRAPEYLLASHGWTSLQVSAQQLAEGPAALIQNLLQMVSCLGGGEG